LPNPADIMRLRLTGLALLFAAAMGADPTKPHPHTGQLGKYERKPPSEIGMEKLNVPTEELRKGLPVLKLMQSAGGLTRSVSVQDIHAPESVVWSAINDLPRYPKMIDGVVACDVYSKSSEGGAQVTCATYKLKAAGFAMEYYMKHFFEPKKHSMTFHLDYTRSSDVSDSVGYWYVEDLKDGWCRVYYSTDTTLPRFIPGFAKDAIVNMAAKRSTSWVDTRCNELTGNMGAGKQRPKWLPGRSQLAAMLALALAWREGVLPAIELPKLPFKLPKLPFALPRLPRLPVSKADA